MRTSNRIPHRRAGQSGFTLTEVIVAVAVFTVVILAALMLYDRSNREFKAGVEASNLQQNTRVAFDKLAADLRMTGYDFDRDGIPVGGAGGSNAYQQPDEQFEYIGPAALTIRANFDYETETTPCAGGVTDNCDNGREKSLESTQFPVVTTGNDEIVTYALVPDSQTTIPACDPTTNCVEFYADTHMPHRTAHPDTANGGEDEDLVQIPGVDLCMDGCNSPPYTLYRFTLDRAESDFTNGAHVRRTPLASNIRSVNFTYYQDAQGLDPLKDTDNTTDRRTGEDILGDGQWVATNSLAAVPDRLVRAKVNSVRVQLIGMNESPDPAYTDPAETVASVVHYRKYALETLTAPRNIQKRGMREQDTIAPGAPTNVTVCTGRCGIVYVRFEAPQVSSSRGAPDQYKIVYGPHTGSGYNWTGETPTFTATEGWVTGLTPNQNYDFAVVALNSYGSNMSTAVQATPLNATKPGPPTDITVTNNLENKIHLTWKRPTSDATSGAFACGPPGMPSFEMYGYVLERQVVGGTTWTQVTTAASLQSTADTVSFDDTTMENCTDYVYRVTAYELCGLTAAYNTSSNISLGYSTVSTTSTTARSNSGAAPKAPTDLYVNQGSSCPASVCAVQMTWPAVTQDINDAAINITRYHVYRRQTAPTAAATFTERTTSASTFTISGGNVTWIDNGVPIGGGEKYEYKVTAQQCTAESGASPVRIFPCTFPAGVLGSPIVTHVGAFDGSGTSAAPWLFSGGSATVRANISNAAQISSVVVNVYNGATFIGQQTRNTAPFDFTFTVPVGSTYRADVIITETGGCVSVNSVYVEEAAQGCCLVPFANDSTIISYSSGSNYVDIYLKNACPSDLNLRQLSLTFNDALTPGGTKFDTVVFPAASGGSNTIAYNVPGGSNTTITFTPPNGAGAANQAAAVTADSTTYKIRVTFTKNLTNPTQPITSIVPLYRRSSDLTDVTCTIK